jgi:hypothetical protein
MAEISQRPLASVKLGSLKAFLRGRGYVLREKWGPLLERYSRKSGSREDNVIIPVKRDIDDFERRLVESLEALSRHLQVTVETIIREVVNAGFETVRIKVNEGDDVATLGYDAAIDLLRGGFTLIDSSAVTAVSHINLPIVRGRRPDVVRKYLDNVRVGQTEVGSFVLTLLMPVSLEGTSLRLPEDVEESFGARVADRFSGALKTAEELTGDVPIRSSQALVENGLTANFSGGIARMLGAAGDLTISVGSLSGRKDRRRGTVAKFAVRDYERMREIERRLTPTARREAFVAVGTVTEFREPRGKASGSITLTCDVHGELRPVRIEFLREHRGTVIEALERKADVFLAVDGELIEASGHYTLESAEGFRLRKQGDLA